MPFQLLFWPDADEALARLENNLNLASVRRTVDHTLDRLERDPGDPRLGTRQFVSPSLGHVRATPTNEGDWHVFWVPGIEPETIEIVEIAEVSL